MLECVCVCVCMCAHVHNMDVYLVLDVFIFGVPSHDLLSIPSGCWQVMRFIAKETIYAFGYMLLKIVCVCVRACV